jgi:hypothetical protein
LRFPLKVDFGILLPPVRTPPLVVGIWGVDDLVVLAVLGVVGAMPPLSDVDGALPPLLYVEGALPPPFGVVGALPPLLDPLLFFPPAGGAFPVVGAAAGAGTGAAPVVVGLSVAVGAGVGPTKLEQPHPSWRVELFCAKVQRDAGIKRARPARSTCAQVALEIPAPGGRGTTALGFPMVAVGSPPQM